LLEHLADLADAGSVFRLLVRGPQRDDPREAQCAAWPVAAHTGGVTWAWRDLVGEPLDHDRRLQPNIGHEVRVHPRRLFRDLEAGHPFVNVAPALVGKAGAELADGHELVLVGVADAGEQGAGPELGSFAFASVVT